MQWFEPIALPQCDKWGVPVEKMPNCPNCLQDELGMLKDGIAFCYACNRTYVRRLVDDDLDEAMDRAIELDEP